MPDDVATRVDLRFDRQGSGKPLLLIHGTGSSRRVWDPIAGILATQREVIAVDLPGHGSSPLAPSEPPTPIGYARVLVRFLDQLGLGRVDVAGNSVGGWTALELAKVGRARSVVAIAPAGLWARTNSRSAYLKLSSMRRMSPLLVRAGPVAFRTRAGRSLLFGQVCGRPWRMSAAAALGAVHDLAQARGFDEHLEETSRVRFVGGAAIDVPVTVAFGKREHLIPRRSRRRDELPQHTRWLVLSGCGHVPMWDDPQLIARTILESVRDADEADASPDAHAAA